MNKTVFFKMRDQFGVTLIELVVFMMIVGIALAGVLTAINTANRDSVNPLLSKQALSIAESLLQEIQQQSFTFCDPDDGNVTTAKTYTDCVMSQDKGGAALTSPTPSTESRYSSANPFDNVADYGGFSMPGGGCAGICLPGDSTPLPDLNGYQANVSITRAGGASPFASMPNNAVLKITVRVTGPANTLVSLVGYKLRYAPNV